MNLLAEAAADIGHDDADVVDSERLRDGLVDDFRRLRVAPDVQPLRRVLGDDRERLERRRAVAMNLQVVADDLVGARERRVDVAV